MLKTIFFATAAMAATFATAASAEAPWAGSSVNSGSLMAHVSGNRTQASLIDTQTVDSRLRSFVSCAMRQSSRLAKSKLTADAVGDRVADNCRYRAIELARGPENAEMRELLVGRLKAIATANVEKLRAPD